MNLKHIRQIGLVGAGTMGAGIGLCFAQAGYQVVLFSRTRAKLDQAQQNIRRSLNLLVQEALLTPETAHATEQRIHTTTRLKTCVSDAQFVIESVPEQLKLKQAVFKRIEALCAPDTILATNTSGLSITAIASVCRHPQRVVGLHWVNPAEFVPLVEVIPGQKTTKTTTHVTYQLAERSGKMPVVIQKEVPGFASNRLQFALLREALHLVDAGVVSAHAVDRVLKAGVGFRYPWLGPLETADLGGLDVFHTISAYLFKELSNLDTPPGFFGEIVRSGKLGIKTGAGFYDYASGDRERILHQRDLHFVRQLKSIRAMQGSDA